MEPLVDIVLATYNGAAHLEAQLASLQAQTYRNWRLIARDDGSTDATPEILARFAAHEARVMIVAPGVAASGPVAAFSEALAYSDAPYFMFCDQDDIWLPEKTGNLLDHLTKAGPKDMPMLVHSDMQVVDADLREIAPSFWSSVRLDAPGASARSLLLRNVVTGCAMMGNGALRAVMTPIPPAAMMHDWWAALLAAHLGRIVPCATPLVRYRRHGENVTGFAPPARLAASLAGLFAPGGTDLTRQRAYLRSLQAQARAVATIVGPDSAAAEFGALPRAGFMRRKTFLARHGLIRWDDPLWSLAYHWVI